MGVIKGNTRSLDSGSCVPFLGLPSFWTIMFWGLHGVIKETTSLGL